MFQELGESAAAQVTIVQGGGPNIRDQGRISEILAFHEHGKQIESLKRELEKKDDQIAVLGKALREVGEKNEELKSALKSKDVEIEALRSRIGELEEEKKSCVEIWDPSKPNLAFPKRRSTSWEKQNQPRSKRL